MSTKTEIAWTEKTWNPTTGCTRVSAGCDICYAVPGSRHNEIMGQQKYTSLTVLNGRGDRHFNGVVKCHEEALAIPFEWGSAFLIFVNSMSDLFHDKVPDDFIGRVAKVMQVTHWHTYQVLTKRPERMQQLLSTKYRWAAELPNVWWGVSVENRSDGLPRLDILRDTPTVQRFLSIEPLLEDLGEINLDGIGWAIVGGESGSNAKARPMKKEWVTPILEQCRRANVPFFFKQWGKRRNNPDKLDRTAKENCRGRKVAWPTAKGGCQLDGKIFHEFPEIHRPAVPRKKVRDVLKRSIGVGEGIKGKDATRISETCGERYAAPAMKGEYCDAKE